MLVKGKAGHTYRQASNFVPRGDLVAFCCCAFGIFNSQTPDEMDVVDMTSRLKVCLPPKAEEVFVGIFGLCAVVHLASESLCACPLAANPYLYPSSVFSVVFFLHLPPSSPISSAHMPSQDKPQGGYDSTPLSPSTSPTYTLRVTFHRATNLPVADFGSQTSDPFILAQAITSHKSRHSQDPYLRFRTNTVRKTLEPVWEAPWVIADVPKDGLKLSVRVYDEDPNDHDDRLGKFEIDTGPIDEKWQGLKQQSFKVKKTGADLKAYALRWTCVMLAGHHLHAHVVVSIEMLGRTKREMGKAYTINGFWWKHYSPMIGRLTGTKAKDDQGVERYK